MLYARAVSFALLACGVAAATAAQPAASADQGYLLPPQAIVDILDRPGPPEVFLSPSRDVVAVLEHAPMPTIAELSRPMLRLAGLRIDPANNGRHRARAARSLVLKAVADGAARTVTLPPSPALTWLGFSADGARFAFTNDAADRHRAVGRRDRDGTCQRPAWRRSQRRAGHAVRLGGDRHARSSAPPRCLVGRPLRRCRACRPAPTSRNIAAASRRCGPTRIC